MLKIEEKLIKRKEIIGVESQKLSKSIEAETMRRGSNVILISNVIQYILWEHNVCILERKKRKQAGQKTCLEKTERKEWEEEEEKFKQV